MTYTVKRCLGDYIVEHLRPAGADVKRAQYAADRLIEFFGADQDVEALNFRRGARAYRAKRLRMGVNDGTIRRELGLLKAALNFAAEEEKIASVPVFKLPPDTAPRERWFTEDEVVKLMEQPMSDRARLYIYLAVGTGARREAIATVPVKRVDLKGGYIDYRDPERPVTKKKRVKTKISKWLLPLLAKACEGKKPDDYVIGGNGDCPSVSREVKKLLRAIGIDEKGISVHAMRRTFSTWAFLNGANAAEVSAATGDRIEMLERSYVKLFPQHTAGAVNAIPNPRGNDNAE